MQVSLKSTRTRVKAIKNIRKITRAMELVSVSKMKRSVSAVQSGRAYAQYTWKVLRNLSKVVHSKSHPLLRIPKTENNILLIAVSSDRGLCGGFNSQVIEKTSKFISEFHAKNGKNNKKIDIISVGKKIEEIAVRLKWNLVASFRNLSVVPSASEIWPIAKMAIDGFRERKYDKIFIIYTDFISTVKQRPVMHRLLPLEYDDEFEGVESNLKDNSPKTNNNFKFIFEPAGDEVLEFILPRAIEVQVYHAILESIASEHSARMIAMKNASDSAKDMADDLTFALNQMRQAMITREIAEIVTGASAL